MVASVGRVNTITLKQEGFALAVSLGSTLTDALIANYDCSKRSRASIYVDACNLAKNSKVALRITELRALANEATIATVTERKEFLSKSLRGEEEDFNATGKAIPASLAERRQASDQLNRMESVYVERSEHTNRNLNVSVDLKDWSLEELKALMGKMEATDTGHILEAEELDSGTSSPSQAPKSVE
ncbi:MAG: hypothetical protein J3T61_03250 [Candidatus Brocadiales bacterium]|nr:hypothetical protein [Candidatus Bathyanammoxibius sp.]